MLKKSNIRKDIGINTEQWAKERLGVFSASEWHNLMGEKPDTQGALSYIYRKVGESISQKASTDDFLTEAVANGNIMEPEAIYAFQEAHGIEQVITQRLIKSDNPLFSATPDALIVTFESTDETMYKVATLEVKCPSGFDAFIRLALCKTPLDLLAVSKQYFWQVLFQMQICGSTDGYFEVYNTHMKEAKRKEIHFRKVLLLPYFKLIEQRMVFAETKFNEVKEQLLNPKKNPD